MKKIYSNGKLLITGEYVVLDGATSLAVPTKYGQSLEIETIAQNKIIWQSFDDKEHIWFETQLPLNKITSSTQLDGDISNRLVQILNATKQLNPEIFNIEKGFKIKTKLNFPKNWGLGTSSTLINNIAQWANVDAYKLLEHTFGGSGYDIACAKNNNAITYQLQERKPFVKTVNYNPSFKEHLFFVHLNKKQNSRDGIKHYKANKVNLTSTISEINAITLQMIDCKTLSDFDKLLIEHENIIAYITKQNTAKDIYFSDFNGCIKSLGAWGGDFVLATSLDNPGAYFKEKGFNTIIPYSDMVL